MYPIPKVHWNHEFLTYIIIIKGCYWKIKSVNKDLPLISNRIQSMHEIIIVFQKRNNDQIWKPAKGTSPFQFYMFLGLIPQTVLALRGSGGTKGW